MSTDLYPLLFEPVYKDYIWGGHRIPEQFHRQTDQELIAESWEVSDRPEGMSVVTNGPLRGTSLHELVSESPDLYVGEGSSAKVFPLLIKIIDAKKRLSVQVHPNEDTAARYGGEAKTEMWYALGNNNGARVFAGLKPGITRDTFKSALDDERLEEVLCSLPMKAGDAIYIHGGRLHAIAEGCLVLEIQQNSNTTYRVYDWGRLGSDGKPRDLHVDKAFQCIDWEDHSPSITRLEQARENNSAVYWEVVRSPYFHVQRVDLSAREHIRHNGSSFRVLFTVSGKVIIEGNTHSELLQAGTSCLVPAGLTSFTLIPENGAASLIDIRL